VLAAAGKPSSLKTIVPDRPGHDRRYLLDSTKIRGEHRIPFLNRDFLDGFYRSIDSRVVHQNMESAKLLARGGEGLRAAGFGGNISGYDGGFTGAANFTRDGFELFAGAGGKDEFCAFGSKAERDGAADAAACAGDDGDFSSKEQGSS